MKYHVRQITDRFQNEIVSGGKEMEITIDSGEMPSIGDTFWTNDISDDSRSGMYEIIGVLDDMAC